MKCQRKPLTEAELASITARWPTENTYAIAMALNLKPATVKHAAWRLGLRKDPAVLSSIRRRVGGKPPSPLGSHLRLLLGEAKPAVRKSTGRVHRIVDDEELAA